MFDVANALLASKQRVTAQAVRDKLGARKSDSHPIPEFVQQEFEKIWRDTRSKLDLCNRVLPESKQSPSDISVASMDMHARMAVGSSLAKLSNLKRKIAGDASEKRTPARADAKKLR